MATCKKGRLAVASAMTNLVVQAIPIGEFWLLKIIAWFIAGALLFIDTVAVCTITVLVIILGVYDPAMLSEGAVSGVE